MNRLIIIFLFIIPFVSISQTDTLSEKSRFLLEVNAGINISKFRNDSINFNSGTKPYFGTSGIYNMSQKFSLKGAVNYSIKGSNAINPNTIIENKYLDLTFSPRLEIFPDFYLQTGLSYSYIFKSNEIINNGDNWNGIEKISIQGYDSEFNVFTGIEFKLQGNVNIDINYTIPIRKVNNSNFQIGLNIALNNKICKESSYRKIKVESSKKQIQKLKENFLLVRLRTSENTINALREIGENEKADKVELNQEIENKKIINAFNSKFDFCQVRFFYSNNSEKVKNKQFENIFLNDCLQVDNSIKSDTNISFLIAEFSYIEQDTMKYFSHYSNEPTENGGIEKTAHYYSPSTNLNFYALRILDHNFVQLNRPFPYYTKAIYKTMIMHPEQFLFIPSIYLVFLPWSYDETVFRMNGKLEKYYRRNI